MSNMLDRCEIHGAGPCDCKAYLVVLGWMDRLLEDRLESEPAFAAEVLARLRKDALARVTRRKGEPQ